MPKKENRFEILLEEIKSNTKLAFEGISNLDEKFEKRFGTLEEKIGTLDNKVGALNVKVNTIDKKVNTIDKKVDAIDKKYDLTTQILAEEIKEVKEIVGRIDQKLDEHVRQPVHA